MSQEEKCVMVLNEELPFGILANTAAVMGITLGKHLPHIVGENVIDQSGCEHLGVITFPVPILKGDKETLKTIREALFQAECADVLVVDFFDVAQSCKTYEEYIEKMKKVSQEELTYFGIALCGPKKKVNKLTGSMPLLR